MIPSYRRSRREVTKRKFDVGPLVPHQKVVISTKVSPLASFAVSSPQSSPKVTPSPSKLRRLAESLRSSPFAAIIEENDDQVTPVQEHDIRTDSSRFLSSTPKPGREASNRRRPVFYVDKPTVKGNDSDLSRISRHEDSVATITTVSSRQTRHVNVSIDEGEGNQTLTLEPPPVGSISKKRGRVGQPKSMVNSTKPRDTKDKNRSVISNTSKTKDINSSVVNDTSRVRDKKSSVVDNTSKVKGKNSSVMNNTSKSKNKNDENRSVAKTRGKDDQSQSDISYTSKSKSKNDKKKSVVNVSRRQGRLNQSNSERQRDDSIIVQSQEASQGRSSVKRRKTSAASTKKNQSTSVIKRPQSRKPAYKGRSGPEQQTDQSEEADENDQHGDVMMLLWEKEGIKRKKSDFCDIDVVLNSVTELLEEERDLCEYGRARKALKLLEKTLVQDIQNMIDSDQTTRCLQRDIRKGSAVLEDKQEDLMDLQIKRIELEEAMEDSKMKETSQSNRAVINTFLKDLKHLIATF